MRRRHALALLVALLPTLAAVSGCGGSDNTNNANTSNANANVPSKIDEVLAKLAKAVVGFECPDSMRLGESQPVTLILDPTQTPEEIAKELQKQAGPGNIETGRIRFSDKMQAGLSGDGFHITPDTLDTRNITGDGQTKWVWMVRPERAGSLYLKLTLNLMVDLGDGAGAVPHPVISYPKVYLVEVIDPSGGARPWLLLLPALVVPAGGLAAWLWLRRRRRHRVAPQWFVPGVGESRIFLSYRREEAAGHAGRLRDALVERFGAGRVFMDLDSIRGGDDFVEALEQAVASCAVVIVVIGRQWASALDKGGRRRLDDPKDFVRLEVEAALRRGVKVIPALVQEAEMPGEESLPAPLAKLARRNAVEISDSRWDYDAGRLIEAVEDALAREPAKPPEPSALPG